MKRQTEGWAVFLLLLLIVILIFLANPEIGGLSRSKSKKKIKIRIKRGRRSAHNSQLPTPN